jgi:hypothetical protein
VLVERTAIRNTVAYAMASPGTSPESADVTAIIERMRAVQAAITAAGGTSRAVTTATMRDRLGLSGGPCDNNESGAGLVVRS